LSKRYGDTTAVDDLSFRVQPGIVTGFLGPNGAGKSTTMRMIAGLDHPSAGTVRINGRDWRDSPAPVRELGVLLEAGALHPGRSARNHLLALAQTNGIGKSRVTEVLRLVGLEPVAGRRTGGFSLGMRQRLGIAAALLGEPRAVVLDEPANGLDPAGIRWFRDLAADLAAAGHTVFVSSHQLAEIALIATRLVVVDRGRLVADTTVAELLAHAGTATVEVHSPHADELALLLNRAAVPVETAGPRSLRVHGTTAQRVGELAAAHGLTVHHLRDETRTLEEAFLALTSGTPERAARVVCVPRPRPARFNL